MSGEQQSNSVHRPDDRHVREPSDESESLEQTELAERLGHVTRGIDDAVREAGRDAAELTLVVITKFQPVSLIRGLHRLGVQNVGESRHQEARLKSAELADLALTWHFIGQLQSKKAKQAAAYCRVIHSVDRDSLLDALAGDAALSEARRIVPTEVFVQVNLSDDPTRGGVQLGEVERMAQRVLDSDDLLLLGVMVVAPAGEEPRHAFELLRGASETVRTLSPSARFISAGMSGDYREAILEGATHLRIGSAITGKRPVAG